jgi:hypothetical protein
MPEFAPESCSASDGQSHYPMVNQHIRNNYYDITNHSNDNRMALEFKTQLLPDELKKK